MKIYTLLAKEEIDAIASEHAQNQGARSAQRRLAEEVTTIVHGHDRTQSVKRVTSVLFGGAEFSSLDTTDLEALANEIPTASLGSSVVEVLTTAGVTASNGEARRLITGGAISLSGQKISEDQQVTEPTLIKKGKNSFILVR